MHCVKSVQVWSFFWSVFSCIQTEYGDLRRNSVFGHFSRSDVEDKNYWKILKQRCWPLAFTVLKNEKRSRTSLPASFSALFGEKISLTFYSINWPNFIVWLPLLLEMLGNMCIVSLAGCDLINFEINLSFLIKTFYHMTKKVRTKI